MNDRKACVDTIYGVEKKAGIQPATREVSSSRNVKRKPAFFYFYKSLQIVLSVWIVTILAITMTPWLDYWVKSSIHQGNKQTLGQSIASEPSPSPNGLARLSLPTSFYFKNDKIEISAPVIDGVQKEDLTKGIGHHPESAWPNQKGNVVLAGHNVDLDAENPYGKVFKDLRDVNIDDQVQITYQGKNYYYKIFKRETVSPDDTSLLGNVDDWILTFYTCDPPYTDWKRLVFQAKLIKIE